MSGKNEQGKMDVTQKNGMMILFQIHSAWQLFLVNEDRSIALRFRRTIDRPKTTTYITHTVFNAPLHQHSKPNRTIVTGYSSGMCSSEMPLALNLTSSFLDWSQQQGTDLRKSGIQEGARLCGYVNTWKAAVDAGIEDIPKVKLEATHHHALDIVKMDLLKKYAAEQDNRRAESRVVLPKEGKQSIARESDQIGGAEPKA